MVNCLYMSEVTNGPGGPEANVKFIYICSNGHETTKKYTVGGANPTPPGTVQCDTCDELATFNSSQNLSLPDAFVVPMSWN